MAENTTLKDQLNRVCYALFGTNNDGLISKVQHLDSSVDTINTILPQLITKQEFFDHSQEGKAQNRERRYFWVALIVTNIATLACGIMYIIK